VKVSSDRQGAHIHTSTRCTSKHRLCLGYITDFPWASPHIEGLLNMEQLVGKGRFRFIGFPLKIRGGTGSPIRAVAWLDA
jgi:hypothetical protein